MIWFLIIILILKVISDSYSERFCPESYMVATNDPAKIPLTETEFNKYYFGYPRPTYDVPVKSVAHPLQFFYNKEGPYTYGGYYQGLEYPQYWDSTYDGDDKKHFQVADNFEAKTN